MNQPLKRREFLIKGSQAGIACCAMLIGAQKLAYGSAIGQKGDNPIDPKLLTYCGYMCPTDCKFLQASVKNDSTLKKQVYQDWKIKEKYNIDFDAEKIFCFGCKNKEKPEGVLLTNCTVRQCAMAKGLECCVECKELSECDKALWSHYPDFKKQVIEMQKKYFTEQAG